MTRRYAEESVALLIGNAEKGGPGRFHLTTLTFHRARQLQGGARPRVPAAGHKLPRVALLEVIAGAVSWDVLPRVEPVPHV